MRTNGRDTRPAGRKAYWLALAVGAAAFAAAQQPPGQRQPSFPAQAELVVVDALVLDARGNPVEGLAAEDFVVREEGLAVPIARFEAVSVQESAARPASRFVSTNHGAEARAEARRSFVIVFDDAQLSRATGERARAGVTRFLETGLVDDDQVTLATTATGLWWTTRAGPGRQDLLAIVGRLEGRRPVDTSGTRISDYEAIRIFNNRDQQVGAQVIRRFYENGAILDAGTQEAGEARKALDLGEGHPLVRLKAAEAYRNAKGRNLATLRTLERVAAALAEGKGRKSVLLVSDGFAYDPTLPEFREVVAAMSRANGAVYFLDARGEPGSADFHSAEFGRAIEERDVGTLLGQAQLETEGAQSVAADTGGFSVRNPNDLAGGMERIAGESRSYYLLGYASPSTRKDGKFRKIQVEVRRPGLEVRARRGYYAPGGSRREPAIEGGLRPAVRQALDSPFAVEGIPMRLAAYSFGPAGPGKAKVLIVADADPGGFAFQQANGRDEATLESYLVVSARDSAERVAQEKEVALSLPPEVRARLQQSWLPLFRDLDLAPGAYQARFLLRDRKSGRIGAVRHSFEIPPLAGLRVTTPILTDTLQPDPSGAPPRPVPLARRSFAAGAQLAYFFEVLGAAPDPGAGGRPRVTSRYELLRGDGAPLVSSEPRAVEPSPEGQLARQVALSLRGAEPGDYQLVLTVTDLVAGKSVEVREAFSVTAPPPSPSSGRP